MSHLPPRAREIVQHISRRHLVTAGVVIAVIAALLLISTSDEDGSPPSGAPVTAATSITTAVTSTVTSASPLTDSATSGPPTTAPGPIEPVVLPIESERIDVSPSPLPPVVVGDEIWVGDGTEATFSVLKGVDLVDTIELSGPSSPALAHDGFLWVPHHRSSAISIIDTRSRLVTDVVEVGAGPRTPLVVGGDVWVVADDGTITIVDAVNRRTQRTIEAGGRLRDPLLHSGRVWVPTFDDGLIVLDADTGAVEARVDVGGLPTTLLAADDVVWVAGFDGVVTVVSASSAETLTTLATARDPRLAVVADKIWITSGIEAAIEVIDPTTLARDAVESPPGIGASSVAVSGGGLVWLTDPTTGRLVAYDDDLAVVADAVIGVGPSRPVVVGRRLYIADPADGTVLVSAF